MSSNFDNFRPFYWFFYLFHRLECLGWAVQPNFAEADFHWRTRSSLALILYLILDIKGSFCSIHSLGHEASCTTLFHSAWIICISHNYSTFRRLVSKMHQLLLHFRLPFNFWRNYWWILLLCVAFTFVYIRTSLIIIINIYIDEIFNLGDFVGLCLRSFVFLVFLLYYYFPTRLDAGDLIFVIRNTIQIVVKNLDCINLTGFSIRFSVSSSSLARTSYSHDFFVSRWSSAFNMLHLRFLIGTFLQNFVFLWFFSLFVLSGSSFFGIL